MSVVYKLNIEKDSKTPVYKQISAGITELVRQGSLKVGEKLPTERELAERLDVARGTISKAYETLTQSSVIDVIQGSGSFISQRQDVVEGERKGKAIKVLENAIDELSSLRFSTQEIATFFQLLLSKREDDEREVRILAIDCNTESLSLFEKQFFYIKNLKITKLLLSDLLEGKASVESLGLYDLILTTTSHHRDVVAKAPQYKDRYIQCSLTLAQQTIMDLAQIPADAKIGVICETKRFYEIVQRHLSELQVPLESVSSFHETHDADALKSFLSDKQVVICRPQALGAMTVLGEFMTRGGSLVYFNYQIDRGTLHQIEDRINEIIKNRSSL